MITKLHQRYEFGPVRAGTVTHRGRMVVAWVICAVVTTLAMNWINQPLPTARPRVTSYVVYIVQYGHPVKVR